MLYYVTRTEMTVALDAHWNKPVWAPVRTLRLAHHMGERPVHFPDVQAKLLYDREALYVIFRVEDCYVRAAAQSHQGPVYQDSCVEFFFTPGEDLSAGYFNFETNCGGTMLFHHQILPRQNHTPISPADMERIRIAHSLPRIVEPEISEPTTWTLGYRLPFELLPLYAPVVRRPGPGVQWRANFYKCADHTSHPHWLTWSPVEHPRPDFHRPMSFGTLQFE